ncbi:MAG TPA: phenylalanine--tRNA ligase subunit beta [Phycisphaerae bacterium]|nr:phenylalanine--tRNA ligase subunit beta [Phycisphaerae bacterium]
MLISLNWLKDFVNLPKGTDPRELALLFTTTTAEVDGVEEHKANFSGLIAGRIEALDRAAAEGNLRKVTIAAGKTFQSLTTAPNLSVGDLVVFAPPGSNVGGHKIGTTDSSGRPAEGMIVAWGSLGFTDIGANAIFLPPGTETGSPIAPATFSDWVIEIDNKSITHRPDCWGHYGIAREIAAMLDVPLRAYDVTDLKQLTSDKLPAIPIEIDDPKSCPRYTALLIKGLRSQPAPLWLQVRLAMCGQRPIDLLVDLTNYIMLELGQPMHAFDAAKLTNIQVATAESREKFTTLDGVARTMPPGTLMIQCDRKSVAIAGIMGGAATEVSAGTDTVLLESANFDAATIRRAATSMGHRTEASARFEKSLDPANTILGIARFHNLAKAELPDLAIASTLSDCYPAPKKPQPIMVDCDFASRFIGKPVSPEEITRILTKLEFTCSRSGTKLSVTPPTYRSTKDIEIEADVIEEVARFIGYNNIEPTLPSIASRFFEPSADLAIESRTLDYLCLGGDFIEVHDYIWYDDDWLKTIGYEPGECITLKNPAADNCSRLRKSLMPGLLAIAERNRHHFPRFQLAEVGSAFAIGVKDIEKSQHRSLGLLVAQSGAKAEQEVWNRLRTAIDGWASQVLERGIECTEAISALPWEDADRTAEVAIAGRAFGRMTLLPLPCKLKIDERLRSWSIALAELNLTVAATLMGRHAKLPPLPIHPQVELDFSILVDTESRYRKLADQVAAFKHPLLARLEYIGAYEGGSIPAGKRSLTLRGRIGHDDRTLSEPEIREFQDAFRRFLTSCGFELR